MSIALTTRACVMANARDIDGKLIDKLSNEFGSDPTLPYILSSPADMHLMVNGWTELGLSLARVLQDKRFHFLKMVCQQSISPELLMDISI